MKKMKKWKQLVGGLFMAAAVLLLPQCVQAEPLSNAMPIYADGTRHEFEAPKGTNVNFYFTTDAARGYYSITCYNSGSEGIDVDLYNGPDTSYAKTVDDWVNRSSNETYTRYLLPNTTYYIRANSTYGSRGAIVVNKIADDYGNFHNEATPIGFGQMVEGEIEVSDLDESDFFCFTTDSSASYYAISIYGTGSRGADCKVYSGPDESYSSEDFYVGSGEANTITRMLEKNHTYYIRMMGSWDNATRYKLSVKKIVDDASNDFKGAKKAKDGKKVSGTIEVRDDVDFYQFKTAKKHTAYKLTLRNTSTNSVKFTLYTRNDIASAKPEVRDYYVGSSSSENIFLKLQKNHTYYLKVSGSENASYSFIMQNSAAAIKKETPKKFRKCPNGHYSYAHMYWENTAKYAGVEIYRSNRKSSGYKRIKSYTNGATGHSDYASRRRTYYYKMCYFVRDNGKIVRGKFTRPIAIYIR